MKRFFNQIFSFFYQVLILLKTLFQTLLSFFSINKLKKLKEDIKKDYSNIYYKAKNFYKTNLLLALYHFYKGNISDAKFRLNLLKIVYKDKPLVFYNLGRINLIEAQPEQAKKHFLKALELTEQRLPEANFYIDYIEKHRITKIPIKIIQERFDHLAHYYVEYFLVGKRYIAHKIIKDEVFSFFKEGPKPIQLKILDLGCGTGVCTHYLKINHIEGIAHGVDISQNMLAIAEKCLAWNKPIFNKLFHEDINNFIIKEPEEKYNLIIAADSLGYIGELKEILLKCQQKLIDKGLIIILVRAAPQHIIDYNFDVKRCYFLYSEPYLESIGQECGLKASVKKCKFESTGDGFLVSYSKLG